MHILPRGDGQRLLAVIRLQDAVALRRQVDLQRRNDIPLIIADQNGVHMPHLLFLLRTSYGKKRRGTIGEV